MTYPPVVIVNDHDEVIGEASLADARAKGLIYRTVFVLVKDPAGRMLLQKRAPGMEIYANCWDMSVGGHVDDGHTYEQAAELELAEEIGVYGASMKEIAHYYTDDPLGDIPSRRFAKIFEIEMPRLPKALGHQEVTKVRWFTKDELADLAANQPGKIADGLHHALPYIL